MYKVTNLSRQIWMSINVLLSLLYTPDSLFVFLLYWMAKFEISSLEGLHNTLRLTWFFFDQLQIYQEGTYCWICQCTELVCVIILWDIVALFETILSIMRACLLFLQGSHQFLLSESTLRFTNGVLSYFGDGMKLYSPQVSICFLQVFVIVLFLILLISPKKCFGKVG